MGPPCAGRFSCDRAAGAGVLGGGADDIEVSVRRRDPWDEVFFDNGASDDCDFFGVRAPVDCDFFDKHSSDGEIFPDGLASDATVPCAVIFSFFFAAIPCAAPA